MDAVHASITAGVTELRESPGKVLQRARDEGQPVAILNHNRLAGYVVSPEMMDALLDTIADRIVIDRAAERLGAVKKAGRVIFDTF